MDKRTWWADPMGAKSLQWLKAKQPLNEEDWIIDIQQQQTLKWWHWVEESESLKRALYCSVHMRLSEQCKLIHGDGEADGWCLVEGERGGHVCCLMVSGGPVISMPVYKLHTLNMCPRISWRGGANIWTNDHVAGEGAGFLNMLFYSRCLRGKPSFGRKCSFITMLPKLLYCFYFLFYIYIF